MPVNQAFLLFIYHFTPIKIQLTPRNIHKIFTIDIFPPTSPKTPIVVVKIRITGPTSANELFTIRAFSIELNLSIKNAANISILPERIRRSAIPNTTFSMKINICTLRKNGSVTLYDGFLDSRTSFVKSFEGRTNSA